ncbi:hypothetical protein QOZ91_001254 [Clostridium sardiniense]|nr:hypothetical protein [Clostridium sardiniense]
MTITDLVSIIKSMDRKYKISKNLNNEFNLCRKEGFNNGNDSK